jgi:hypothetical protein
MKSLNSNSKVKELFNSPWAKLLWNNIFPEHMTKYSLPKLKTYSTRVKNIIVEEGKVVGLFEDRSKTEILFNKLKDIDNAILEYKRIPSEIFFNPKLQIDFYNAYKDTDLNIIPNWYSIKFNCSCDYSDYLNPCWHTVGTFMRLLFEIDNSGLILLKMQGVDLTKILEIDNSVQKLLTAVKKQQNENLSKSVFSKNPEPIGG